MMTLDISYKPLSALGSLYIAAILHMAYRIWWLFPYMKYPDDDWIFHIRYMNCGTLLTKLNKDINADLKMDRNGQLESGLTEKSTHLSIIHPAKGRHGVLGRLHKKVSVLELH